MCLMKRVMIIGSPGTGKSFFAKKLEITSGLPLIHLDYYYHDRTKNYYTDKQAWRQKVEELTDQDKWIIDGNYGSTMSERMKKADTIIYFDIPRRIALFGVLKRCMMGMRTKRTDMPSDWNEKTDWNFLKYVWGFNKNHRTATKELLSRNRKNKLLFSIAVNNLMNI